MRRTARALGLILFGTLLALLGLEAALRVAGVGGPAELGPEYDRPVTGYAPHAERLSRRFSTEPPGLKVAVVGDSFTLGYGNHWYDAYPRRLEHLLNLNTDAPPAEVRVFARNDTTTWDQLRFLDAAMAWEPDLLVLGIFLNDTEDPGDAQLGEYRQAMSPRLYGGWTRRVLRTSRLAAWVHLRLAYIRGHRAALALQDRVFTPDYPGFVRFRQALRRFKRVCRTNDVKLVAVVWPSMGGLGPRYPHQIAHQRLGEALKEARIPYLDLLEEFQDKSSARLAVYPDIDNHPDEIGHRIGATAIYRFLVRSRTIDRVYASDSGARMNPGYWLRRVRRKRSPQFFVPSAAAAASAETDETTGD